ncbi:hypothetical protein NMG60_11005880 [Bertholletia excelsa]
MEESLPPGFRFHPTDEELITYYLTHKVSDFSFTSKAITDVDLNKCEPWDLPAKASMGEKEWYFFSLRDRKYPTGLRTNRATEAGYWKTTGKDKEIFRGGVLVGMKKTLVFYRGRAPKEEWVVCRVFQKSSSVKKPQQTPSSQQDIDSPCDTNTMANEYGDIELHTNLNCIMNPSSAMGNISLQTYTSDENIGNTNMTWTPGTEATSALAGLSWPPSLLNPNLSMNSLLLRALQLKNYQAREAASAAYSFTPQSISNFGTQDHFSSNFPTASSSKVLDSVVVQQQQQQHQHQEQPFNLDSIW